METYLTKSVCIFLFRQRINQFITVTLNDLGLVDTVTYESCWLCLERDQNEMIWIYEYRFQKCYRVFIQVAFFLISSWQHNSSYLTLGNVMKRKDTIPSIEDFKLFSLSNSLIRHNRIMTQLCTMKKKRQIQQASNFVKVYDI
jgi:hypothetical protein